MVGVLGHQRRVVEDNVVPVHADLKIEEGSEEDLGEDLEMGNALEEVADRCAAVLVVPEKEEGDRNLHG